jgi:O-antigen/teichoic acid export membrane protein
MLARLVEPRAFGLVALCGLFLSIADVFVRQGFGDALVQRETLEDDHIDAAFWLTITAGFAFATVTVLGAPWLARQYREPELTQVLRWLAVTFPLSALCRTPEALLTRQMDFRSQALRSLFGTLGGGLVGISLALWGFGVWSLVAQQLTTLTVSVVTLWYAVTWRPRLQFSVGHARQLYSFGVKVTTYHLFEAICQKFDQILVGYIFGSTVLGAYSLAWRTVQMVSEGVVAPTKTIAFPAFSHMARDPTAIRASFGKATELLSAVTLPVFAGIAAVAADVVLVGLGPKWAAVTPYLQALCAYAAIAGTVSLGQSLFMAAGRPGLLLMQLLQLTALTAAACLIGGRLGPVAVAWAVAAAMLLHSVIHVIVLRRVAGIPESAVFRAVAPAALAAAGMFIIVNVIQWSAAAQLSPLLRLAATAFGGAIAYLVLLNVLAPGVTNRLRSLLLGRYFAPLAPPT